jgi:glycosyltransferase involved in cell wall biosynthesis
MYQGYPAIGFLPWSLRGRKTAVVTTVHDMQRPARTSRAVGRLAFEALLYGSHRLLVNGEAELRRLAKRPMLRARSTVLPNGSNILVSGIDAEQKKALRASVARDDSFLLGFFGLVRPGKGLEVLLDAIARLRAGPVQVELLVIGAVGDADPAGGAAYRDLLLDQRRRLRLESSVKFLGHLPEPRVSELLQVCDLGVLPFDAGAFTGHTSVFAALSHGLPLLTTQGPSTEAVFTQGAMSLVPAPPEPQALADAIYALMKAPEKRDSMVVKGRELADRFTRPALAARVAEIYAAAVGSPATAASNTASVR